MELGNTVCLYTEVHSVLFVGVVSVFMVHRVCFQSVIIVVIWSTYYVTIQKFRKISPFKIWAFFPIHMLGPFVDIWPIDIWSIPSPFHVTYHSFLFMNVPKSPVTLPITCHLNTKKHVLEHFNLRLGPKCGCPFGHSHKLKRIMKGKIRSDVLERLSTSVDPDLSTFYQVLLCLAGFFEGEDFCFVVALLFYFVLQKYLWIIYFYVLANQGG